MRAPLAFALALAVLGSACADEPPPASANLRRPSGMAYAERERRSGAPSRDDLFVADSESEGVRVRQFEQSGSTVSDTFLPSFVVFIPLSIAAPGFPEEVALSNDPGHSRLYALSPAGTALEMPAGGGPAVERVGLLHVLDVREVPFGARATTDGNVPIGTIALDQLTSVPAIPTDVEVLASASDTEDLVAVALDTFDGSDSILAVFKVRHTPAPAILVGPVETATLARGVRSLVKFDASLFASSVGTSSITEVAWRAPGSGSGAIVSAHRIDAGGPTSQLLGGPGRSLLAIRVDRSAVTVLDRISDSSPRFERSRRYFASPYTPKGEREDTPPAERSGVPAIGRLDLRASPAAVGALGRVSVLSDSEATALRGSDFDGSSAEVALIGHLDGLASFVVGSPPRLAFTRSASVAALRNLGVDAVEVVECGGAPAACLPPDSPEPGCSGSVVVFDRPVVVSYRAIYRGALAKGRSGVLEVVRSSTSALDVALRDSAVFSFEANKVLPGDQLLVQVRAKKSCEGDAADPEIDLIDAGVISAVSGGVIEARFTGQLADFQPCGGVVTVSYEAYPAVEEAVLTEMRGEEILAVHERVPAAGGSATFARELAFTLRSTGGFACRDASPSELTCANEGDCGPARACRTAAAEGCLRTCEPTCTESGVGCIEGERTRVCTGIELIVDPTRPLTADLRGDPTRPTLVAAPAAALFSPLRSAWFVTYPGSRTMAEIRPLENGFQIGYAR